MKRMFRFFEAMLIFVALLSLAASFLLPRLFELKLDKNEMAAQTTLKKVISPALENFARDNAGGYPMNETALMRANPPYVKRGYNGASLQGYVYRMDLSDIGYSVEARPVKCGVQGTGRKIFTVTTGGIYSEADCAQAQAAGK